MNRLLKEAIRRTLKQPIEARTGRLKHRLEHARARSAHPTIDEAIDIVQARWPAGGSDESPIFLLSAGWRSGSTLLQRLLMSAGDSIVWGEPYNLCGYVQSMAESLRSFTATYPPNGYFLSESRPADLTSDFVANLYPDGTHLWDAHRAFFTRLFAEPARALGYDRWGLKEVRLGAEHAGYLRALFPDARLIFLYRNPYAAYKSYRYFGSWYLRWPDEMVFTAQHFGRLWTELTSGYLKHAERLGAHVVAFEKLMSDDAQLHRLSDYTGVAIDRSVLDIKVSGRGSAPAPHPVPAAELRLLRRAVDPLATELGYEPPRA